MSSYLCGFCGQRGHNRRTCPQMRLAKAGYSTPASASPAAPSVLPVEVDDWDKVQVGDIVRAFHRTGVVSNWEIRSKVTKVGHHINAETLEEPTAVELGRYPIGTELTFDRTAFRLVIETPFGPSEETQTVAERIEPDKPAEPWDLAELVIDAERIVLLYGPPGTGKTYIANKSAKAPADISNLTATEETPAAELRGHFIPKGGEFHWMDGPIMQRFRNGGRAVINEVDKLSGDALQFLNAVLDDSDISAITLPTGETVYPHPSFTCVATMNGEPEDLPPSLEDRFTVRIRIEKPHPSAIKTLPKDLRKAAKNGMTADGRSISMRGWKRFADLRVSIGEANAAKLIFEDAAETILNTLKIGAKDFGHLQSEENEEDIPF